MTSEKTKILSRYRWPLKTQFILDDEQFYVLEEAALEQIKAERERSEKLIERLRYVIEQVEMSEVARDAFQAIISVYFEAKP